ncbi:MAG: PAS domain-containing protein [Pleomorphochaeta sp.]
MVDKNKEALLLIKNFCISFYKKRDIKSTFKYLSDEVLWCGPNKLSEISNYEQLEAIFLLDISLIPSSFTIKEISEYSYKVTENVYNVHYNARFNNKQKNISFELSLFSTILYKEDIPKIVSLKFDYITPPKHNSGAFKQHIKGGLLIAKHENKNYISIESINNQFASLFNLTLNDEKKILNTNFFEYIHTADVAIFKHQLFNNNKVNLPFSYKCRLKLVDTYSQIMATIVLKKISGTKKYFMVIQPLEADEINEYKNKIKISNPKEIYSEFGTHENIMNDKFTIQKINNKFCQILGYTPDELLKYAKNDYFNLVHKNDIEYLKQIYNKLSTNRPKNYVAYRLIDKNNKIVWVKENLSTVTRKSNKIIIKALVEELDYINNSKANEIDSVLLQDDIDSKFLIVDMVNNRFETDVFENSRIKFSTKYINNLPNSLLEKNIIYKDDNKSFIDFYNKTLKQQKNKWIGRVNLKNNKIGWYQVISYTLFNNSMPIKALCIITNINDIKNILVKFNKHQELIKIIISDYEFIGEYDSFTNRPIFMFSPTRQKDFVENSKNNNFDFLINNVIHNDDIDLLLDEKNKTFNHTYNGIIPDNNEFDIRYRSLTNRFKGFQWGKIKYIYRFDNTTKHLHTIILIKNNDTQKRAELTLLENLKN